MSLNLVTFFWVLFFETANVTQASLELIFLTLRCWDSKTTTKTSFLVSVFKGKEP